MTKIEVEFWGVMASKVGKAKETIVLGPGPKGIRALIERLGEIYGPRFQDLVLDTKGELAKGILVLINGKPLHQLDNSETALIREGSSVIFTFPLMGG